MFEVTCLRNFIWSNLYIYIAYILTYEFNVFLILCFIWCILFSKCFLSGGRAFLSGASGLSLIFFFQRVDACLRAYVYLYLVYMGF